MKCHHQWRVDYDNFMDDGCIGAICIVCGTLGCACDVLKQHNDNIPDSYWRKEDTLKFKEENNYVMDCQQGRFSSNYEL